MSERCQICQRPLGPGERNTFGLGSKVLLVACNEHADKVRSGARSAGIFARGALIAGARQYLQNQAPSFFGAARRAWAAYQAIEEATAPGPEEQKR